MIETWFLDRDGVLIENRDDYVKSWDEVCPLPGAFEAVRRLTASGARVVLITNQSAIGRGIVSADTVQAINRRLKDLMAASGARLTSSRAARVGGLWPACAKAASSSSPGRFLA